MTRVGWTGTRLPSGGFTHDERCLIALDVAAAGLVDGDFVGSGLCDGVDEEVVLDAAEMRDAGLRIRILGFAPAARYRRRLSERAWSLCDEVIEVEGDELERDHSLVAWADQIRAIPRYPCERRGKKGQLFVIGLPRSGTGYTIRRAEEAGKLVNIEPLRPPLDGRPVPPIRLKTAGATFPAAASGTFASGQHAVRIQQGQFFDRVLSEQEILDQYRRFTEQA